MTLASLLPTHTVQIHSLSDEQPLVLFSGDAFSPSSFSTITLGQHMPPVSALLLQCVATVLASGTALCRTVCWQAAANEMPVSAGGGVHTGRPQVLNTMNIKACCIGNHGEKPTFGGLCTLRTERAFPSAACRCLQQGALRP